MPLLRKRQNAVYRRNTQAYRNLCKGHHSTAKLSESGITFLFVLRKIAAYRKIVALYRAIPLLVYQKETG
jgi:hypothetical protein